MPCTKATPVQVHHFPHTFVTTVFSPGMPAINLGSLRKKQENMAAKRDEKITRNASLNDGSPEKIVKNDDSSESEIPPWKVQLMNNRRDRGSVKTPVPTVTGNNIVMIFCSKNSILIVKAY